MGNRLKLVRDFFPFDRKHVEDMKFSDTHLVVNCSDGQSVVASKTFLAFFSQIIRNSLDDIPRNEDVTLILPFSKQHFVKVLEFLATGEAKGVNKIDIENIKCLLESLGVKVLHFEQTQFQVDDSQALVEELMKEEIPP